MWRQSLKCPSITCVIGTAIRPVNRATADAYLWGQKPKPDLTQIHRDSNRLNSTVSGGGSVGKGVSVGRRNTSSKFTPRLWRGLTPRRLPNKSNSGESTSSPTEHAFHIIGTRHQTNSDRRYIRLRR